MTRTVSKRTKVGYCGKHAMATFFVLFTRLFSGEEIERTAYDLPRTKLTGSFAPHSNYVTPPLSFINHDGVRCFRNQNKYLGSKESFTDASSSKHATSASLFRLGENHP